MDTQPVPFADTQTPNYAFVKVEVGASEDTWGDKTNGNWDKADAAIKAAEDDAAAAIVAAAAAQATAQAAMPRAGGAFAGAITVLAPVADAQPATKKYVDDLHVVDATFRAIADTADTPSQGDNGKLLLVTGAQACTITAGNLAQGTALSVQQMGAGQVMIAPASGVTLVSDKDVPSFKTARRGAIVTLTFDGANTCFVVGGTA